MIGNNSLNLNQATLRAAIQMYLDSQRLSTAPAILVTSVSPSHGTPLCVDVEVQSPSEAQK